MSQDHQPTIVVADDEQMLTELYESIFGQRWSVVTAHDGEEALKAISESTQLVTIDREMPGPSGNELRKKIEEHGYQCRTVMITGNVPEEAGEMGFDRVHSKPVSRDELLSTAEELTNQQTALSD